MIDHGNTQSQQKVKLDDKCVHTNVHLWVWVGGFASNTYLTVCFCVCVCLCVCVSVCELQVIMATFQTGALLRPTILHPGVSRWCVNHLAEIVHTWDRNVSPVTACSWVSFPCLLLIWSFGSSIWFCMKIMKNRTLIHFSQTSSAANWRCPYIGLQQKYSGFPSKTF